MPNIYVEGHFVVNYCPNAHRHRWSAIRGS